MKKGLFHEFCNDIRPYVKSGGAGFLFGIPSWFAGLSDDSFAISVSTFALYGLTLRLVGDLTEYGISLVALYYKTNPAQKRVTAIFAPESPQSGKKGQIQLLTNDAKDDVKLVNGRPWVFGGNRFAFSIPFVSDSKKDSHSITKGNIAIIEGDCAPPGKDYVKGQIAFVKIKWVLIYAHKHRAKGGKDNGQYLSRNTLVKKKKWLTLKEYWLMMNTITVVERDTGIQLIERNPRQKQIRLKYSGMSTLKSIENYLMGIPVWIPPALDDFPLKSLESPDSTPS